MSDPDRTEAERRARQTEAEWSDATAKYSGDNRRAPERWRVKKEISLGDLIAFTSAALAVVYAYSTLDSRLKLVEVAQLQMQAQQQRTDERQDNDSIRYQVRIEAALLTLGGKLDRLLEQRK